MRKQSIYNKMVLTTVAPVVVLGLVIMWFCYFRFTSTLYDKAGDEMDKVADTVMLYYDKAFSGEYSLAGGSDGYYHLYKGETEITDNNSIVDELHSITGCDISLLYMDMRINTTFKTETGKRFAGVYTNSETSDRVLNGESVFYKDIPILNEEYLVYYKPLLNPDDSIVGMVEISMRSSYMKKSVLLAIWPILLLSLGGVVLACFISYRFSNEITRNIRKIQKFLGSVAGGELQTELDMEVLKRKDELGEIGKASTSMQRSIRGFVETDPLTQLGNRRYIHGTLDKIKNRFLETGMPFAVAIGDIDFFKKVNDTYGHNAGDEVLKAVAATLKRMMQGKGIAGRWGGEEFVMIFDKADEDEAEKWLWRILEEIRALTICTEGYEIKVTMTFGVVEGYDETNEALVEAADARLYYGKTNGRNRVVSKIEEVEEIPEIVK